MDPLSVPVGAGLPDPKAAEALALRAESLSETLGQAISNLNIASAEGRERITAAKSGVVPGVGVADRRAIADAVATAIDKEHRALHAELAKNSESNRYAQLREANEKAAALAALATVYPSPVAYLSGTTVGNTRRNDYAATVADAGPPSCRCSPPAPWPRATATSPPPCWRGWAACPRSRARSKPRRSPRSSSGRSTPG